MKGQLIMFKTHPRLMAILIALHVFGTADFIAFFLLDARVNPASWVFPTLVDAIVIFFAFNFWALYMELKTEDPEESAPLDRAPEYRPTDTRSV